MKCNWLILTLFLVGCVLLLQTDCQAQEGNAPASSAPATAPVKVKTTGRKVTKPAAKIKFENLTHDFGEVGQRTKNTCEFKFTNTGNGSLKIGRIETTCGCTATKLAKKEYAPGESGAVKVTFSAGKGQGQTSKRLYVSSNDRTKPKVALTIKARIVSKVTYEPAKLNLLFNQENAGCPKITLKSLDGRPFAIKGFKSTGNSITADYDSSVEATSFVLEPKVDIEKLKKGLNGYISLNLSHPQCRSLSISFNTLQEFEIKPRSIVLFKTASQEPTTREVWILNNYGVDFEIESTSSKGDFIKVLSQEKVGNRYKFKLEITPPTAEKRTKIFRDEFYVNIKTGEKLKLPVIGSIPAKK